MIAKKDPKANQKKPVPKKKAPPSAKQTPKQKKAVPSAAGQKKAPPSAAGQKKAPPSAAGQKKAPPSAAGQKKVPSSAGVGAGVKPAGAASASPAAKAAPKKEGILDFLSSGLKIPPEVSADKTLAEGFLGPEKKWDSRDAEKKKAEEKKKKEARHKKKQEQKTKRQANAVERAKKDAEKKENNQKKEIDKLSPKEKKQVERGKKKGQEKEKAARKKEDQKKRTQQNKDQKRLAEQMKQKPQTKEQKKLQKDYQKEQKQKKKDQKKEANDRKKKDAENKKKDEDKKVGVDVSIFEKELAKGELPWLKAKEGKAVTDPEWKDIKFGGTNKDGESKGQASIDVKRDTVVSDYSAKISAGSDGVKAEAEFEAGYKALSGDASVSYDVVDGVNLHGKAEGYVGAVAEGNGSANFTVGKDGINASLDGELGVYAAKGEVSGGVNIFGIDISGKAEGKVGAGVEAGIGFEDGKFHANLGATLGIGGSVGIEVDFSDAIENVTNFVDENKEKIDDAIDAVGDTVGGAVDAVKGWFGW